jgi:heat shock protein HslJ
MRLSTLCIVLILALAILVAGCTNQPAVQPATTAATPAPATPAPTASPAALLPPQLAGNWVLTSMGIQGGTAITHPTTQINLIFNPDGSFTGYDGCNNYFGTFILTGTSTPIGQGMTLGGISSSKKYCADLASQEQQYLNILGKTSAYVVDGTQLTLTGEKGDVLIYQRPATLATPTGGPWPA